MSEINERIAEQMALAKKLLQGGNRERAKQALVRAKMLERQKVQREGIANNLRIMEQQKQKVLAFARARAVEQQKQKVLGAISPKSVTPSVPVSAQQKQPISYGKTGGIFGKLFKQPNPVVLNAPKSNLRAAVYPNVRLEREVKQHLQQAPKLEKKTKQVELEFAKQQQKLKEQLQKASKIGEALARWR
jgi:hypothetical protein